MTTLYAQVGAPLAAAIAATMTRCPRHGFRVAIDACPCVLADGIAYYASPKQVACAVHHLELAAEDQGIANRAAAVFAPTCLGCLTDVIDGVDPFDQAIAQVREFRDWIGGAPAGVD